MPKPKLTEQDFTVAAVQLNVEVAVIKAVAEVESRGDGFLATDEPKILFERHKFHQFTQGRFDATAPDISNAKAGGYGPESVQHGKLARAIALDRDAALRSCSWGKFQVMGFHWEILGYASLQEFINGMYESEGQHLIAFVRFVKATNLARFLQTKNWAAFAAGYNGAGYRANQYDTKMSQAYARHS